MVCGEVCEDCSENAPASLSWYHDARNPLSYAQESLDEKGSHRLPKMGSDPIAAAQGR